MTRPSPPDSEGLVGEVDGHSIDDLEANLLTLDAFFRNGEGSTGWFVTPERAEGLAGLFRTCYRAFEQLQATQQEVAGLRAEVEHQKELADLAWRRGDGANEMWRGSERTLEEYRKSLLLTEAAMRAAERKKVVRLETLLWRAEPFVEHDKPWNSATAASQSILLEQIRAALNPQEPSQ